MVATFMIALILFLVICLATGSVFFINTPRIGRQQPVLVENLDAAKKDLEEFLVSLCLDDASLGIPAVIAPAVKPHQQFSAAAAASEPSRGPWSSGMYMRTLQDVLAEQTGPEVDPFADPSRLTNLELDEHERKMRQSYAVPGAIITHGPMTEIDREKFKRKWLENHASPPLILTPGPVSVARFYREGEESIDIMPYTVGYGEVVASTTTDEEYVAYNALGDVVFSSKQAPAIPTERARK